MAKVKVDYTHGCKNRYVNSDKVLRDQNYKRVKAQQKVFLSHVKRDFEAPTEKEAEEDSVFKYIEKKEEVEKK